MRKRKLWSAVLALCLLFSIGSPVLNAFAEGNDTTREAVVAMQDRTLTVSVGDTQLMSGVTKDKSVRFVQKEDGQLSVRYTDAQDAAIGMIVGTFGKITLKGEFTTATVESSMTEAVQVVAGADAVVGTLRVDGYTPVAVYGAITSLQVNSTSKVIAYSGSNITEAEMRNNDSHLTVHNGATVGTAYTQYSFQTLTGRANIGRITGLKTAASLARSTDSSRSRSRSSSGGGGGSWSGGGGGSTGTGASGDFTLEVLKSSFNVGDSGANAQTIFRAIYDGDATGVILVNQDGDTVATLLDNGDVQNGDDILDDGVYSALVTIDTTKEAVYTFQAKVGGEVSNTITINVYSVITDAVLEKVELVLDDMDTAFAAAGGNKTQFISYLNQLETAGDISGVAMDSSNPDLVTFEFAGGVLGGYMLEDFDPNEYSLGSGDVDLDSDEDPEEDPDADEDPEEEDPEDEDPEEKDPEEDTEIEEDPDAEGGSDGDEDPSEDGTPVVTAPAAAMLTNIMTTIDNQFQALIKEHGGNNVEAKDAFYQYLEGLQTAQEISDLQQNQDDSDLVTFAHNDMNYRYHMQYSVGKVNVGEPVQPSLMAKAMAAVVFTGTSVNTVGNNRVLIASAFSSSDTNYMSSYSQVADDFRNDSYGYQVTERYDATVDTFKTLNNYGIIFINSHGTLYKGDPVICLDEVATKQNMKAYNNDLKDKRIAVIGGGFLGLGGKGGHYYVLPKFIEHYYGGNNKLPNSLVHMCICKGYANDKLVNAFTKGGAGAVLAYTDTVLVSYDGKMMLTTMQEMRSGKTADEARLKAIADHGEPDDSTTPAYYRLKGNANLTLVSGDIVNGGFENLPQYIGWNTMGDTRIIASLASLTPPEGNRMSIISTGLGAINDSNSAIYQNFTVPANANKLSFTYNVVSEEPMEWVGTQYDDTFIAKIMDVSGNDLDIVAMETINTSQWYYIPDIDFYGGDDTAYETKWQTVEYDISAYRGQTITLYFWVYDRGDSIYDTAALIDDVKILY